MDPTTDNLGQPGNTDTGGTTTQTAGNNGGFDFSSAISAEYASHPSIQKFNGDINNMAKSYLSLEQLMGQGRVPVPKDASDAVAWEAYDKAFGIPEADKYDIKSENGDVEVTPEFRDLMKRNHISNAAAQDIFNEYVKGLQSMNATAEQERLNVHNQTIATLKSEWGAKYQQNLELANNTLAKFCENKEDYASLLDLVGDNAAAIRLLNKIGSSISEGSLGGFEGQVSGFTKTPSEAQAEFDRIMADTSDAYWAGSRNHRNDMKWCKEHGQQYVSEEERLARVQYVQSLLKMLG